MQDFILEDNVRLSCDIKLEPELKEVLMYECKFVNRLDLIRSVATDPLPLLTHIKIKQDKMQKPKPAYSSASFEISSSIMKDDPNLGHFELQLKPGIKCSTINDGFGGLMLDCL